MDKAYIEFAARQYADREYAKSFQRTVAQEAFYAGADYAMDTKWVKASEALPADEIRVIGRREYPHLEPDYVVTYCINEEFITPGITHWCHIPYFNQSGKA